MGSISITFGQVVARKHSDEISWLVELN